MADADGRRRAMRVVVIKSPKLVGGILRRLFGIRREKFEDT